MAAATTGPSVATDLGHDHGLAARKEEEHERVGHLVRGPDTLLPREYDDRGVHACGQAFGAQVETSTPETAVGQRDHGLSPETAICARDRAPRAELLVMRCARLGHNRA